MSIQSNPEALKWAEKQDFTQRYTHCQRVWRPCTTQSVMRRLYLEFFVFLHFAEREVAKSYCGCACNIGEFGLWKKALLYSYFWIKNQALTAAISFFFSLNLCLFMAIMIMYLSTVCLSLPGLSWAWTRSQIWFTWKLIHGMEVSASLTTSPSESNNEQDSHAVPSGMNSSLRKEGSPGKQHWLAQIINPVHDSL